jgi:hypothetical protein
MKKVDTLLVLIEDYFHSTLCLKERKIFFLRLLLVDYQLLHLFSTFVKEIGDGANLNFD